MIQAPYIPPWQELRPFVGEIWLVLAMIGVLLTPFFTRKSNAACALVSLAGLGLGFVGICVVAGNGVEAGSYFRGMLVSDTFALFFRALLLLFTFLVVVMWLGTSARKIPQGDGPEFFTLLLGATLGMALMSSTSNLLMIFLAVELASLPSYVLAGFRKTDPLGAEASLKYVLFGAASSAVMVYGLSLLYGLYGTLSLPTIAKEIAAGTPGGAVLAIALVTMLVGIGFKITAVPMHFWCPDVFEGAGIEVAAFLSVASKGAALALALRIVTLLAAAMNYDGAQPLVALAIGFGVVGALTCTLGNTAALAQNNIKRLLAYSSIAQAGYMLCLLSLLCARRAPAQSLASSSAQALLIYLVVYLFMNLGAFAIAAIVQRSEHGDTLADFSGLGRRNPVLALCMAAFMFSLVGLPPFAGFAAKLNIMATLGRNGGWWWWLVGVIAVNTVLSLYYYARVVKVMFLESNEFAPVSARPLTAGVAVICAAALVALLLGFGGLARATGAAARIYAPWPPGRDVAAMR